RGESVRIDVPTEIVPIPLSASVWSEAVFHRQIAPADLFSAVIADRNAALLCHGLSALDSDTLLFLGQHHPVITKLYERVPASFAAFGGSVKVRQSRMIVPGGDVAIPLWE